MSLAIWLLWFIGLFSLVISVASLADDSHHSSGFTKAYALLMACLIPILGLRFTLETMNESHKKEWCKDQVAYSAAQVVVSDTHCFVDGNEYVLPHWLAD